MAITGTSQATKYREKYRYDPATGKFYARKGVGGRKAGAELGYVHSRGYVYIGREKAHRIAFLLKLGGAPEEVDHINGDKTDNRWENLRPSSRAVNNRNAGRRKDNTTGVVGVSFNAREGKWVAQIGTDSGRLAFKHADFFEVVCWRKGMELEVGYHQNHGRHCPMLMDFGQGKSWAEAK